MWRNVYRRADGTYWFGEWWGSVGYCRNPSVRSIDRCVGVVHEPGRRP